MSEFSKQYCESTKHGFAPDFDVLEIANTLNAGYYIPQICEGYGFIGIAKDDSSNIIFAFRADDNKIEWKKYSEVII